MHYCIFLRLMMLSRWMISAPMHYPCLVSWSWKMMTGLRQKKPSGLLVMQLMGRIHILLFLWCVYCSLCTLLFSKGIPRNFFLLAYASCDKELHVIILSVSISIPVSYTLSLWSFITIFISYACFTFEREIGITLLRFEMRKEIPSWKLPIWKKPRNSTHGYCFLTFLVWSKCCPLWCFINSVLLPCQCNTLHYFFLSIL